MQVDVHLWSDSGHSRNNSGWAPCMPSKLTALSLSSYATGLAISRESRCLTLSLSVCPYMSCFLEVRLPISALLMKSNWAFRTRGGVSFLIYDVYIYFNCPKELGTSTYDSVILAATLKIGLG